MKKKVHTEASRIDSMVCPLCGISELVRNEAGNAAHCGRCESMVNVEMLTTLGQIAALSTAVGRHPCECGHPEMKRLPDGFLHCPSCGSEVAPVSASPEYGAASEAYLSGWAEGLFARSENFTGSRELARWEGATDRLDYYRGHRAGRAARSS